MASISVEPLSISAGHSTQEYWNKIQHAAEKEPGHPILYTLAFNSVELPRVAYKERHGRLQVKLSLDKLLRLVQEKRKGEQAVCIIEDINRDWIGELGFAWDIDEHFFMDHAAGHDDLRHRGLLTERNERSSENKSGWKAWKRNEKPPSASDIKSNHFHIDGRVPHVDACEAGNARGNFNRQSDSKQCSARISYCRLCARDLYIILVDRPLVGPEISPTNRGTRKTIGVNDDDGHWDDLGENELFDPENDDFEGVRRVKSSKLFLWVSGVRHPRGLPIPQLFSERSLSLFSMCAHFISKRPNFALLFASGAPIDPTFFAYSLSQSLWRENWQYLNSAVKAIAFGQLRSTSDGDTNNHLSNLDDTLRALRQDLDTLRSTIDNLIPRITNIMNALCSSHNRRSFRTEFSELQNWSGVLERFLMDTFQLLMTSASVAEARSSAEDAQRSARLTLLATIYVPLSFATGIFGMNVREINDSSLSVWVFVVTLFVISFATLVLLAGMKYGEEWVRNVHRVFGKEQRRKSVEAGDVAWA